MSLTDRAPAEYAAEEFKKLDLRGALIEGKTFRDCTFTKCNFAEAVLRACTFHDCAFSGCDLSLAKLPNCNFKNAQFKDCQLIGIDWTETAWASGRLIFKPADFRCCVLNHSTFMGLSMKNAALRKCVAREASFEEADLSGADCRGTDFSGSRFANTNLSGADFRGALNYQIAPGFNNIKKTRFSLPEAMSLLYNMDIVLEEEAED